MILKTLNENARKSFDGLDMPLPNSNDINFEDITPGNEKMIIVADDRIKVIDLSENPELAEKYLKIDFNDKMAALHYSILNDAKLIVIPKNTIIENPIFINSKLNLKSKAENIIIVAEENSKAAVIEVSESSSEAYFKSASVEIISHENSSIDYVSLQNLGENTYSFSKKTGLAKKNSSINWIDIIFGGKFGRCSIKTVLNEEGASTRKLGAFFGNKSQNFDINAESVHAVANTNSWMYHRGVLNDNSKAIFRGNIKINRDSKNSAGHQKSDILLIGDNAKCDAVPVLDVDNDEVTCSHGVTLGQVDEEQIFYMTSRGLDEKSAKKMIILGFLENVIKEVKDTAIRGKIYSIVEKKLAREIGDENE